MDNRPVIFLDINGPIAPYISLDEVSAWEDFKKENNLPQDIEVKDLSAELMLKFNASEFSSEAVKWVNLLCEEFGAVIVISSSLRNKIHLADLKKMCIFAGGNFQIVGTTHNGGNSREEQIWEWVSRNRPAGFRSFICIDDKESWSGEILPNCLLVNEDLGITESDYLQAREKLANFIPRN